MSEPTARERAQVMLEQFYTIRTDEATLQYIVKELTAAENAAYAAGANAMRPIPTSERLPSVGERVLVCQKEYADYWFIASRWAEDRWCNDAGDDIFANSVEFWLPLPTLPSEEGKHE